MKKIFTGMKAAGWGLLFLSLFALAFSVMFLPLFLGKGDVPYNSHAIMTYSIIAISAGLIMIIVGNYGKGFYPREKGKSRIFRLNWSTSKLKFVLNFSMMFCLFGLISLLAAYLLNLSNVLIALSLFVALLSGVVYFTVYYYGYDDIRLGRLHSLATKGEKAVATLTDVNIIVGRPVTHNARSLERKKYQKRVLFMTYHTTEGEKIESRLGIMLWQKEILSAKIGIKIPIRYNQRHPRKFILDVTEKELDKLINNYRNPNQKSFEEEIRDIEKKFQ